MGAIERAAALKILNNTDNVNVAEYLTPGQYFFNIPAGVNQLWLDACGPGGGGGGGYNNNGVLGGAGGGSAGGDFCLQLPLRIPPGTTQLEICIPFGGQGGIGGANPTDGTRGGFTPNGWQTYVGSSILTQPITSSTASTLVQGSNFYTDLIATGSALCDNVGLFIGTIKSFTDVQITLVANAERAVTALANSRIYTNTNTTIRIGSATLVVVMSPLTNNTKGLASYTGVATGYISTIAGTPGGAGTALTITGVTSGSIGPGSIISGTGITTNTVISGFTSGTLGGIGYYTIAGSNQTVTSTAITAVAGINGGGGGATNSYINGASTGGSGSNMGVAGSSTSQLNFSLGILSPGASGGAGGGYANLLGGKGGTSAFPFMCGGNMAGGGSSVLGAGGGAGGASITGGSVWGGFTGFTGNPGNATNSPTAANNATLPGFGGSGGASGMNGGNGGNGFVRLTW